MKVVHHIDGNPWNNHPSNLRVESVTASMAADRKPMLGTWTLTAPDGRQWTAPTPIACAAAESRERIPASVALARIHAAADEPTELEKVLVAALRRIAHTDSMAWAPDAGFCGKVAREALAKAGVRP